MQHDTGNVAGRALEWLCLALAVAGGLLVGMLALMTMCSVVGRWCSGLHGLAAVPVLASFGPITGDFEMTKMGTAVAVFLFLPYCHLRGGHVTVDLLMMHAPRLLQRVTAFLSESLFLTIAGLMTWRLALGMAQKLRYQETTMLLEIPVWWGYAAGIVGLALLTLVCGYRAVMVWRTVEVGP